MRKQSGPQAETRLGTHHRKYECTVYKHITKTWRTTLLRCCKFMLHLILVLCVCLQVRTLNGAHERELLFRADVAPELVRARSRRIPQY